MGSITHDGTIYNYFHVLSYQLQLHLKFLKVSYNYIMSESITITLEVRNAYVTAICVVIRVVFNPKPKSWKIWHLKIKKEATSSYSKLCGYN